MQKLIREIRNSLLDFIDFLNRLFFRFTDKGTVIPDFKKKFSKLELLRRLLPISCDEIGSRFLHVRQTIFMALYIEIILKRRVMSQKNNNQTHDRKLLENHLSSTYLRKSDNANQVCRYPTKWQSIPVDACSIIIIIIQSNSKSKYELRK